MSDQEIEFQKRGMLISYQKMIIYAGGIFSLIITVISCTIKIVNAVDKNDVTISNHTQLLGSHSEAIKELKDDRKVIWQYITDEDIKNKVRRRN